MGASSTAVASPQRLSATLLVALLCLGLLGWVFREGLTQLVHVWLTQDEYSHGFIIPLIAGYLAWQKRAELVRVAIHPAWSGTLIVACGVGLNAIGGLATVPVLQQYSFILTLGGLVAALYGWSAVRLLAPAFVVLLFMVPLPNFLLNNFSAQLQLISSQLGVWFVRLFGISVFVEGNVIDLGTYKLQVAEACDGLRYLFPLMTMGFLMACFFRVAMWKRALLFLSSIPLTILMNSFRIGTIGVMVEHWGVSMAEGFLHEFQGWAVFMASAALMLLVMMLLSRLGPGGKPWREAFGVPRSAPSEGGQLLPQAPLAPPLMGCAVLLLVAGTTAALLPNRVEAVPVRETFSSFPMSLRDWSGRRSAMEQIYLDTLRLDDYVMADYVREPREAVNFYVAWYGSQRSGQSAHSPRACLPGGGWHIAQLDQKTVDGVQVAQQPLRVNRVRLQMGSQKQLAYYWFQQRGRVITSEYLVKWFLFWDGLTRNRTDGALVRLVVPLRSGESFDAAEQRLDEFAAMVAPQLERYVPD
ncbi:MAG TPA: VPLPA-CTERM-specific exosortase XrtD [Povalibacter sp.]|nr:VPLPA-CTERM-specific exosortase XrtD [Povalibacter sp.]